MTDETRDGNGTHEIMYLRMSDVMRSALAAVCNELSVLLPLILFDASRNIIPGFPASNLAPAPVNSK
jgi:hypothetical protein